VAPWCWFPCKPKHVGASSLILKFFNNSTFLTLCALVGHLKCLIVSFFNVLRMWNSNLETSIFMLFHPASWYPARAQRFVQFQCSRWTSNFDSFFQTHLLHSCRIPYSSLMCWVGRCAHHACPFDHFRTVCTIFRLVHSPYAITVRVHLYQFALNFSGGVTCFVQKKRSISRTSSGQLSLPLHINLSHAWHLTDSCAIFCILLLLQALLSAKEQNTSLTQKLCNRETCLWTFLVRYKQSFG
jgi:hypothetical protein